MEYVGLAAVSAVPTSWYSSQKTKMLSSTSQVLRERLLLRNLLWVRQ